jgi:hypothetical protein
VTIIASIYVNESSLSKYEAINAIR